MKTVKLILLATLLFSSLNLYAQENRKWLLRADAGIYELHGDTDGLVLGVKVGRRLGSPVLLGLGLTRGMAEDSYTALELGLELLPFANAIISPVIGVGAGIMAESASPSPSSLPYFWQAGLQIHISERNSIRLSFQRGSHANMGDPGTFSGPSLVSIGWARAF